MEDYQQGSLWTSQVRALAYVVLLLVNDKFIII